MVGAEGGTARLGAPPGRHAHGVDEGVALTRHTQRGCPSSWILSERKSLDRIERPVSKDGYHQEDPPSPSACESNQRSSRPKVRPVVQLTDERTGELRMSFV